MKVKFYKYILPVLCILTYSCTEDLATDAGSESLNGAGFSIPISIDIPEVRTRAIDMTPGAALFLKDIWVGYFNVSSGKLDYHEAINLNNYYVASNTEIRDLVRPNLSKISPSTQYCIVAVANCDGIKAIVKGGESEELGKVLDDVTYWSDFINIAIDTQHSEFGSQTPMLMGYLSTTNESKSEAIKKAGYIKVDQFDDNKNIPIYCNGEISLDNYVYIRSSATGTFDYNTNNNRDGGYLLKLRRMRSKINVNVDTKNGIIITDLQYKVFNRPKSAFLAPRRTNDFTQGEGKDDVNYSPNSGDVLYADKEESGYIDDEYFTKSVLNSSFSFEHFENKHWAMRDIAIDLKKDNLVQGEDETDDAFAARCAAHYYHEREKNDGNGLFNILADKADDWNNNASYFMIKMNLRDENTGRNAEVYYTIHEGFINDKFGGEATSLSDRLHDFSCIRNTDYYYNITVNGVNDIHVQVTTDGSHTTDQAGSIWQINYSSSTRGDKESLEKRWPAYNENDNQTHGENYVAYKDRVTIPSMHDIWNKETGFNNSKDIAFRLVGSVYDPVLAKESPVDVCYNFARGELDGFAGLWPVPTNANTEYIVSTDNTPAYDYFQRFLENDANVNSINFRELCNHVRVIYGDDEEEITIAKYIEEIQGDESNPNPDPNIKGYRFEGLRYYEAFNPQKDDKRNHVRGLYIFDRKKAIKAKEEAGETDRVQTDGDKCSYLYEINGAEQVPYYLTNEYYKMQKNEVLEPTLKNESGESESKILTDFKWFDPTTNNLEGNGEKFLLSASPELAFRVIGYDENGKDNINATEYYDIWYNVKADEYFEEEHRNIVWPEINRNGIFSTEIAKGKLDEEKSVSSQFLQGIRVVLNEANDYSLVDFVNGYEQGRIKLEEGYTLGFQVNDYEVKVRVPGSDDKYKQKYMRALYLFDRKNKFLQPLTFDEASNTATFKVYGVEQYPNLLPQLQLPKPQEVSYQNLSGKTSYVNILDQSIGTIRIPALGTDGNDNEVPYSAYRYKIISKAGTGTNRSDASLVIDNRVPDASGAYEFAIPMKAIAGKESNVGGTFTIQAVSENGDIIYSEEYYASKELSDNSFSYTLTPPPTWSTNALGINANNDFYKAYQYGSGNITGPKGTDIREYNDEYKYLNFSGGTFVASGNKIKLNQNASTISFMVYKPCKITISSDGDGVKIYANDAPIKDAAGNDIVGISITAEISESHFGGNNSVKVAIRRAGSSGVNVSSIQVLP